MKSRIAMAISLVGVLGAGSAAALVNSQVLRADASGTTQPASVVVATAAPTTAFAAQTTVVTIPPAVAPETTATTQPTSTQVMYQVGEAGTVTIDTATGRLAVVAATPAEGWTVADARTNGEYGVLVTFQSGSLEVEFSANNLYGIVGTSVESRDFSVPQSNGSGSQPSNGSGGQQSDHDDDDDDYEEGEDDDD